MPRLFAVMRSRGPAWNHSLPLDEQADWPRHADFMNALHAEGFVLLGGPLERTQTFCCSRNPRSLALDTPPRLFRLTRQDASTSPG